ncbi:MAG: hypothetical protein JWO36_2715 [Myxococcales bacterium]|nr:hypothetical protein [Myxococcales bacterium]
MRWISIAIVLVGCGSQIATVPPDAAALDGRPSPIDAPYTTFILTSPVIAAGAAIPVDNTCDGNNVSPALAWNGGPASAMSFAVILTDKAVDQVQWVIYDIPATRTALPANIDRSYAPSNVSGAHQTMSYQPTKRGYRGPCPPLGDAAHGYEFAVYALDVATLPSTNSNTPIDQAAATIVQHQIDLAKLHGTYARLAQPMN